MQLKSLHARDRKMLSLSAERKYDRLRQHSARHHAVPAVRGDFQLGRAAFRG